jgi:transcriptional regulator with XRE-family HTH domain
VTYQRYDRAANIKLGKNLAKLRRTLGLSQDALAERLGISVRHMQRVESGKSAPSLPLLLDLYKALKADWNQIFNGF